MSSDTDSWDDSYREEDVSKAKSYFASHTIFDNSIDLTAPIEYASLLYRAYEDGEINLAKMSSLKPGLVSLAHILGKKRIALDESDLKGIKEYAEAYRLGFVCEYYDRLQEFKQKHTILNYSSWRNKIKRQNKRNHTSYSSSKKTYYSKYLPKAQEAKSEAFRHLCQGYLHMSPFTALQERQIFEAKDSQLIRLLGFYGNLYQRERAANWFVREEEKLSLSAMILSQPLDLRFAENVALLYGKQLVKAVSLYCQEKDSEEALETMQSLSDLIEKRIHFKDNGDSYLDEMIPAIVEAAREIHTTFKKDSTHKTILIAVLNILKANILGLVKKSTYDVIDLAKNEIFNILDIPGDMRD